MCYDSNRETKRTVITLRAIAQRIKQLRTERGMTQEELAFALSARRKISKSAIGMYETARREPDIETMEALADCFGVDMDYLLGKTDHKNRRAWLMEQHPSLAAFADADAILPLPRTKKVPLLGTIACGEPIYAEENTAEYLTVPEEIEADFCLRCKGDSMIGARICDGDIVYLRAQESVDNGQIAAVVIGDEATLKRVYLADGKITLAAANEAYAPLVYVGDEMGQVRIIGRAVAFTSHIR